MISTWLVPILLTCLGAFLGGMLRYCLSRVLPAPWGTFSANVLACAALGVVIGVSNHLTITFWPAIIWHAPISLGFAGALSTWSTFAKELGEMLHQRKYARFSIYCFGTLTAGIGTLVLLMTLTEWLLSRF